jgi:hypothetical protein
MEIAFGPQVLTCLVVAASLQALACRRENPSNQTIGEVSAAGQVLASQAINPEAIAASKTSYDEAAFGLSLSARGKLKAGEAGELAIALVAKPPFHVNLEYPHRFKVLSKQGLTTPADTIQRDTAKLSESKLEMSVPVTLTAAGPASLEGEMSFSVCTSEKCLIEKRRLSFESRGN